MKVGIQTYSVRESLTRDPRGTLQKVADMGYKYWETCLLSGLGDDFGLGIPVKEAKKFIDDNGVKIVGAHIASRTNLDTLDAMFDYHKELGNDRVGLSAHFFDDKDDLLRKCEKYNEVGEFAKARGMHFYYHNHFHEFQKFDGEYVMDILLANTDPKLVSFELDAFWAARGGMDPVESSTNTRIGSFCSIKRIFQRPPANPSICSRNRWIHISALTRPCTRMPARTPASRKWAPEPWIFRPSSTPAMRLAYPTFCSSRISPSWTRLIPSKPA